MAEDKLMRWHKAHFNFMDPVFSKDVGVLFTHNLFDAGHFVINAGDKMVPSFPKPEIGRKSSICTLTPKSGRKRDISKPKYG